MRTYQSRRDFNPPELGKVRGKPHHAVHENDPGHVATRFPPEVKISLLHRCLLWKAQREWLRRAG